MVALKVMCFLISWWMFLMPAKRQDWKLLSPCAAWMPTMSRPWNCWVFLKRHLSSGFRIDKLQIYLILPTSLNVPETFSWNIMWQMWSLRLVWMESDLLVQVSGTCWSCMKLANTMCHLLPKVTERLKPGAQNMMKVSLAAQVMSSTVSLNDT